MADVVVTLPKSFGLKRWIEEGDAAGEKLFPGETHYYWKVPTKPKIERGERVYVVYSGRLIGYAPLVGIAFDRLSRPYLVRKGDAVAVTIPEVIKGFQGYRYRWWDREDERPFPEWRDL